MLKIYSRPDCKYCTLAIELLLTHRERFDVITCENCAELKDVLSIEHGIHVENPTFPQIVENGVLIGGYTDLCKHIEEKNDVFEIDDCF
jgi:glutaredoxin